MQTAVTYQHPGELTVSRVPALCPQRRPGTGADFLARSLFHRSLGWCSPFPPKTWDESCAQGEQAACPGTRDRQPPRNWEVQIRRAAEARNQWPGGRPLDDRACKCAVIGSLWSCHPPSKPVFLCWSPPLTLMGNEAPLARQKAPVAEAGFPLVHFHCLTETAQTALE